MFRKRNLEKIVKTTYIPNQPFIHNNPPYIPANEPLITNPQNHYTPDMRKPNLQDERNYFLR